MAEGEPRVAAVTGGLVGIGLACARALTDQGLRVAVGARRGGEAEAQAKAATVLGEDAVVLPLDVRSNESVEAFCGAVLDRLGPIDVLVNSAGIGTHELVCGHKLDTWHDVIETNLTGPFLMIRACLPGMIARKWGRIVNIASTAARAAMPDYGAYCASKSGLLGLTRAVALEGAPHGVTCVAVSPTWVETEMLRNTAAEMAAAHGRALEAEIDEIARSNPQHRLVQPGEIGALVAFLCSDAAAGLTMEDIQVNAGAHW